MLANHPYSSIVFDLDGTLVDTWPALLAAVHSCSPGGVQMDATSQLRPAMSLGIEAVFQRAVALLPLEGTAALQTQARMTTAYLDAGIGTTQVYDGAAAMLQTLRDQGYAMALCTNRDRPSAQALLRHLGWTDLFTRMVCLHECAHPKPHALPLLTTLALLNCAPQQALFVGDSGIDARCAVNAEVHFAAHLQGYHTAIDELQPCVVGFSQACELTSWLMQGPVDGTAAAEIRRA